MQKTFLFESSYPSESFDSSDIAGSSDSRVKPVQHESTVERILLQDAEILYFPDFLKDSLAKQYFNTFSQETPWRQDKLNFGGRSVPVPRLQAWFGDKRTRYSYSGLTLEPLPWTRPLEILRDKISELADTQFNSVLLNYYRNGQDSVAWHSDDETELGKEPIIASLSLGATRRFELKHKTERQPKSVCELGNGSLLVMGKGIQGNWQHAIPKQPGITEGRINLTFRFIYT